MSYADDTTVSDSSQIFQYLAIPLPDSTVARENALGAWFTLTDGWRYGADDEAALSQWHEQHEAEWADGLSNQAQIDALNAQIATLTADKAALNSQITQLNADKAALNNKIALLDDTMTYYFNNISPNAWSVSFWANTTSNNTSNIAQFVTQNAHSLALSRNNLNYDGVQKTANTANTWIFWQFTGYGGNLYVYKNCVLVATLAVGYTMYQNSFVKRSAECMIANLTCYLTTSFVFSSPPARET